MKNIIKTRIVLSCMLFLGICSEAFAIAKLDFVAPVTGIPTQVNKVNEKVEEQYGSVMEKLNEKMRKAVGAEGAALFKSVANRVAKSVVTSAQNQIASGNFNPKDIIKASVSDLGNTKLDMETVASMASDYAKALEKEKMAKDIAMNKQLVELQARYEAAETEEEKEEYAKQIASLKAEKEANLEKQTKRDEKVKELEATLKNLNQKLAEIDLDVLEEDMTKMLEAHAQSLFEDKEDEENENMYEAEIGKFFLGKLEYLGGEGLARVKKNRNKAYYEALQNLYRVAITSDVKTDEISATSTTMVDTSTEQADGLYGAMAMRIGADIQTAKTAARFTELLLAEIHYATTDDLMGLGIYKLHKYDKDFTKFNLDEYVLTDKDLKSGLISKAKDKISSAVDGWKGF